MPAVPRIAVVGAGTDRLVSALRALPLAPDVAPFRSVFADSEPLTRFHPELLLLEPPEDVAAVAGAVRLLRHLLPGLAVLLVCERSEEVALASVAQQLGALPLVDWERPGRLVAALEQARAGGRRPSLATFVDLAHGIADAINNPLQLVAGHLQLVRATLAEAKDAGPVAAALAGVQRIQDTVDSLRAVAEAADGPGERVPVDVAGLLRDQLEAARRTDLTGPSLPATGAEFTLGDRAQLQAATTALVRFAKGLADAGFAVAVDRVEGPRAVGCTVTVTGEGLDGWLLPRAFEPYYPNRLLRGGNHGLDLFLAQAVTLGHGGQAQAQRQEHGRVLFSFALPRAGSDAV
jgi:signal transduction histidine kinase